jgi:hypothetical protein
MSSLILTPKQIEACILMSHFQNVLLEGGSRSGKTVIVIRNQIIRAMHYPETWHLSVRLRNNHIRQSVWKQTLPFVAKMMGLQEGKHFELNNSDLTVTFPNKSVMMITGLDDKVRVEKILGNEFATIFVNEASQIAYDSIETLTTRLNPPRGVPPRFWIDYNPPSMHHWGYKIFHERKFPDGRQVPENDYKFIKMNPADNPYISETLINTLNNLSGSKRTRFLEGGYSSDDGALWKRAYIKYAKPTLDLIRVVVGVDPSGSLEGDEVGIITGGIDREGNIFVLRDNSLNALPKEWSEEVKNAYEVSSADTVAAEKNFGGDMVEAVITQFGSKNINVKLVNASRGKAVRAEPVAALYAKGKVFHVEQFVSLEDEICTWKPTDTISPNRMDALVWTITELMTDTVGNTEETVYENGVDNLW